MIPGVLLQAPPRNAKRFLRDLQRVSPGNLRAIWLPKPNDTTSTTSPYGVDIRAWSYNPGGLITNGDFETNTVGWTASGAGTVLTRVTTDARFGSACCKVDTTATGRGALFQMGTLTNPATYTGAVYVKGPVGEKVRINIFDNEGGALGTNSADVTFDGTWQRISVTDATGGTSATGYIFIEARTGAQTFYIDGARCAIEASATPFGANVSCQGNGVLVSFNGTTDYATTPDTANLSFGNGTADSPFSVAALVNVTDSAAFRTIVAKISAAATTIEYILDVTDADLLRLWLYDQSAGQLPQRISDSAITQGSVALFGATYTAATGGATAANDITLYQNGAVIASTATNAGTYVAMEDTAALLYVGGQGTTQNFFGGTMGFVAVYAGALSTAQHATIARICRDYYGVTL